MSDAAPAALPIPELKSEQEIVDMFNQMRQEQSSIMARIADGESERHEHGLVRDTLTPLEKDRRCHRLVAGVLVERSVGEVLPLIEESITNFDQLLKNLNGMLVAKDKQLEGFMAKYKIRAKGQGEEQAPPKAEAEPRAAKGVLA